jgi:hypothetical protein
MLGQARVSQNAANTSGSALTSNVVSSPDLWCQFCSAALYQVDRARSAPPNTLVNEADSSHIVGSIDIAQIDDHRLRHFALQALQIKCAELRPFRDNHERIGAADASVGVFAIFDARQFLARLLHADRIVRAHLGAHDEQAGDETFMPATDPFQ